MAESDWISWGTEVDPHRHLGVAVVVASPDRAAAGAVAQHGRGQAQVAPAGVGGHPLLARRGVRGQVVLGARGQHDPLDDQRCAVHRLGPQDAAEQFLDGVGRREVVLLHGGQVLAVRAGGGDHLSGQPLGQTGVAVEGIGGADQGEEPDRTVPAARRDVVLELADEGQHGQLARTVRRLHGGDPVTVVPLERNCPGG